MTDEELLERLEKLEAKVDMLVAAICSSPPTSPPEQHPGQQKLF